MCFFDVVSQKTNKTRHGGECLKDPSERKPGSVLAKRLWAAETKVRDPIGHEKWKDIPLVTVHVENVWLFWLGSMKCGHKILAILYESALKVIAVGLFV